MEGTNRNGFTKGKGSEGEGTEKMNECKRGRDCRVEETEVSSPFLPFRKGKERNSNEEEILEKKGSLV